MSSPMTSEPVELPKLSPELPDPLWKMAAFIDVETTGLYCDRDEIIELSVILFCFDPYTGEIKGIVDQYNGLREPTCDIHPDAFRVHGIGMKMLKGNTGWRKTHQQREEKGFHRSA